MKKRFGFLFVALMLTFTLLLFGCSNDGGKESTNDNGEDAATSDKGEDADNNDSSGSEEQVTIKVSLWDYSNLEYYKNMFASFEAEHPNIKIDPIESSSAEYDDLIQVKLSAKEELDVVFNKGIPALSALISKGHMLALDDYINNDADFNKDAYSGLVDQLVADGQTYSVPFRKDNHMIFYNKDMFDAAGVAYPEDGMTMEEYYELAKEMTSGEGAEKVYGAHIHTWVSNVSQFARRTEEFNPIGDDMTTLRPYYETILKMQEEGVVQDFGSLKASNTHYSGEFYNGRVAMLQIGTWFINMLYENVDFNWGVCSLPNVEGTGNDAAVGAVTSVGIGSYAKYPDEAWELIKYVAGEEGAIVLAENGILPGYSSDAINDIFDGFHDEKPNMPDNLSEYIDIDKYVIEFPMHEMGREVDKIIAEEHDLIMTDSVSVDEGLQHMTERVNEILGQ